MVSGLLSALLCRKPCREGKRKSQGVEALRDNPTGEGPGGDRRQQAKRNWETGTGHIQTKAQVEKAATMEPRECDRAGRIKSII